MKDIVVSAKNLVKTYNRGSERVHALRGTSFEIRQGDFVSIVGPSGSGKTTLLNLIGCLDTPSGGSLEVMGREIGKLKEKGLVSLRRENIGFVFQQFFLLPTLTVEENITLPLLFGKDEHTSPGNIRHILQSVGLEARANHRPHELSGGEMQRVAVGRALVHNPRLLLADEPTGNLDSATAAKIFELFNNLNQQGITLVIVTHNMELARQARTTISIRDGEILRQT
jgi:ABC-type lipoprotein export system ATPase subunit